MGLFDFFRRGSTPTTQRSQILDASASVLDIAFKFASPWLEEQVEVWTLDNPSLLMALGYNAGFIDAAYQSTQSDAYDESVVERAYVDSVARNLKRIKGAKSFVKGSRTGANPVGKHIAELQRVPQFMKGMTAGGADFTNFANQKRQPLSLAKLLGATGSAT